VPITDATDLKRKIKLILSQIRLRPSMYQTTTTTERAEIVLRMIRSSGEAPADSVLPPAGAVVAENEQLTLLRLMYSEASPILREGFVPELVNEISATNAPVIVHAVLAVGSLDDVRKALRPSKAMSLSIRGSIWWAILETLIMESHRFTDADLDTLEIMAREDRNVLEGFLKSRPGVRQ
jgi:hypothetical protein